MIGLDISNEHNAADSDCIPGENGRVRSILLTLFVCALFLLFLWLSSNYDTTATAATTIATNGADARAANAALITRTAQRAALPVSITSDKLAKTAVAMRAIIAALLYEPKRELRITALGSNLRLHGITNWKSDFAPELGSLADFIRASQKVFSMTYSAGSDDPIITLSAAASQVATKSLADSKSGAAAATATNSTATAAAATPAAPTPIASASTPVLAAAAPAPAPTATPQKGGLRGGSAVEEGYSNGVSNGVSRPATPARESYAASGGAYGKRRQAAGWGWAEPAATVVDILLNEPNYMCPLKTVGSLLNTWGIVWRTQYFDQLGTWSSYISKLPTDAFRFDWKADTIELVRTGPGTGLGGGTKPNGVARPPTAVAPRPQNHLRHRERRSLALGYSEEPLATVIDIVLAEPNHRIKVPTLGSRLQTYGIQWAVQYNKTYGSVQYYVRSLPKIFAVHVEGKTPVATLLIGGGAVASAADVKDHKSAVDHNSVSRAKATLELFRICPANEKCGDNACALIHGTFDPDQVEYLKNPEPTLPLQAFNGTYACKFTIGPKRYCMHETKCKHRHLKVTRPLTSEQKAAAAAS